MLHIFNSLVGAHRRKGTTPVQQEYRVKNLYKHSGFTMQNLKHDVALLELKSSVDISDKVATVCLPTEEPAPGTECYITGLSNVMQRGTFSPQLL